VVDEEGVERTQVVEKLKDSQHGAEEEAEDVAVETMVW